MIGLTMNTGKRLKTVGWFVPALWALTAWAGEPPADADALFKSGEFEQAGAAYTRRLASDSSDADAQRRLGEIALLGNDLVAATTHLTALHERDGEDEETAKLLAEVHYRRHEFAAAAELFRLVGRSAKADQLAAFKNREPYKIGSGPDATTVPFILTDPLPLIHARVNGSEPVHFIIDTGGGEIILDPEFANGVGIESVGSESSNFGGDKKAAVEHGLAQSVQLGDLKIQNVPINLLSTRRFAAAAGGKRVDGIIGTIALYRFAATMNYVKGHLVLRRPNEDAQAHIRELAKRDSTIVVPFWLAGDHIIVAWGRANDGNGPKNEKMFDFLSSPSDSESMTNGVTLMGPPPPMPSNDVSLSFTPAAFKVDSGQVNPPPASPVSTNISAGSAGVAGISIRISNRRTDFARFFPRLRRDIRFSRHATAHRAVAGA